MNNKLTQSLVIAAVVIFLLIIGYLAFMRAQQYKVQTTTNVPVVDTTKAPAEGYEAETSGLCSDAAIETEGIGSVQWPVAPQYRHLSHLGEVFTAGDCSEQRLLQVVGGEQYRQGSTIWLKAAPSSELLSTLKSLNFACSQKTDENQCTKWTLSGDIDPRQLIKLKAYTDQMIEDDCVNCG